MKKRFIVWFSALGAGILALVCTVFLSKEPAYAGKPLSFWVRQYPARLVFTNGYSEMFPGVYATRGQADADNDRLVRSVLQARLGSRRRR